MKSNFYLLQRIGRVGWDENRRMLIRACTEESARLIASQNSRDEGSEVWKNPNCTTCVIIPVQGESGLLMADSKAG